MIEVGEIQIYLNRSGMLISWLDREAHISGSIIRSFGCLNEDYAGAPITGKIGLFDFEVLGYDKAMDMFHVRRK